MDLTKRAEVSTEACNVNVAITTGGSDQAHATWGQYLPDEAANKNGNPGGMWFRAVTILARAFHQHSCLNEEVTKYNKYAYAYGCVQQELRWTGQSPLFWTEVIPNTRNWLSSFMLRCPLGGNAQTVTCVCVTRNKATTCYINLVHLKASGYLHEVCFGPNTQRMWWCCVILGISMTTEGSGNMLIKHHSTNSNLDH